MSRAPRMGRPPKSLSIRLDPEQADELAKLSELTGVPQAELVRRGVKRMLRVTAEAWLAMREPKFAEGLTDAEAVVLPSILAGNAP